MAKTTKIPLERILRLWSMKNKTEWKQYHVLRDEIHASLKEYYEKINRPYLKNATERTVMRYLHELVQKGTLEKKVDLDHKTWYRPKDLIALSKELIIKTVEFLDNAEAIDYLHLFIFEYTLHIKEEEAKEQPFNLRTVIEKTTEQVLSDYDNIKMLQDLASRPSSVSNKAQ